MSGGSTNLVLHLLAVANEAGVPLEHRRLRPHRLAHAAAVRPQARSAASWRPTSTARAACRSWSQPARRGRPAARGRLTVTGQTIGEVAAAAEEAEGQEVVRPLADPLKPNGGFAILRGNLAPDGCVVKLSGHGRTEHSGPARVFECEEEAFAAVMAQVDQARRRRGHPQRGPAGRPGHARDAARDRRARRRGPGRLGGAAHRRPLLRRHPRLHGGPRGARGAARRPDRRGARRRHDRLRRGKAAS